MSEREVVPESCSDLGAEGQVTEEMVRTIARVLYGKWADEYEPECRVALEAALSLSPLSRRVEALEAENAKLREMAEIVVFACLPLLPLNGSADSGYRISDYVQHKCVAEPQEWADAAYAIAGLHGALLKEGERNE